MVRQNARLVQFNPAQNALLVHDKNRAVRAAQFFVEHAVLFCRIAVGPKIGDERIVNAAERFAPGLFRENRIATDSQNLAVHSIQVGALRVVGWNLLVSRRGERERVKRDGDIFAVAIIAQFDFDARDFGFGDDARQSEIRRGVAGFE